MSISDRIIKKRQELGFSQTDLAKRAGLKPPAISQYESGNRNPSYEALIKLSNAMNVSTDYLISGKEISVNNINDKNMKLLLKILDILSVEQKDKVLEYAMSLVNSYYDSNLPILNDSLEYSNYILKNMTNNEVPIDVYKIAEDLNITIFKENIEGGPEGILIKGEEKIIIINEIITNNQRKKFTLAILIGHAIIPWHIRKQYNIRKPGTSTLLVEDIQEMEAQSFAANLLMPKNQLTKDLGKTKANINTLKELVKKYDVSLFQLLNRLVEYDKDKFAVVQSKDNRIIKTYQGNRALIDEINIDSKAATFFADPSKEEEIREGRIPAEYWLQDSKDNETIYEESIYNPSYGKVLTLLTIE